MSTNPDSAPANLRQRGRALDACRAASAPPVSPVTAPAECESNSHFVAGAAGKRRPRGGRYHVRVVRRATALVILGLTLVVSGGSPPASAQASAWRILSREGTRALPVVSAGGRELVALDDVAGTFGLTLREDRLVGGVTVSTPTNRTIIVTPEQNIVSVAGRVVSLSAAPRRDDGRWLLPLDFLQRAVGPALDTRIEVRAASRLIVVGDLRVPRVTARVDPGTDGTSVAFDITPATPAHVTQEAGRLVVQFEADALDLALPAAGGRDLLQALQPGETPTSVRIVPGPKFAVHRATTSQPEPGTSRLVVDLLPAGAEAPAAPASPAPAPAPADPIVPLAPPPGLRTIVIDPGHGGDETGVRGPGGTLEKDVTLAVARRLRALIEGRLGLRVFLTRDDDRTLPLDSRAAYANSQKADLFISLHANAALSPARRGAEVYYLSSDGVSAATGFVSPAALPALGGGSRIIDLIPWDTAQSRYLDRSATLAGLVEQTLRTRVEMSPTPVQRAPVRVLVGANMPAVLVEMGYLSNPSEERALASGATQDRLAQSLYDAIVQFRSIAERPVTQAVPDTPR